MDEMVIFDYWRKLDRNARVKFREKVMKETGMQISTFYLKIRGEKGRGKEFRKLEKERIISIIKEDVGEN